MIVMLIGLLAFVIFAISLILGIANLSISLIRKKQSKSPRKFFWTAIAAFLVFLVVVLITPDENETAEPEVEVAAEDEGDLEEEFDDEEISLDESIEDTAVEWEDEIENIAAGNGSPTEKFEAVEEFATTYPATEDTIQEFIEDIIANYKAGNYLDNSEEEYLIQIFKSTVVEGNSPDGDIKEFAFDYWQVQKYVYRGAEQPDGRFVKENEYQMDKALVELDR